MPDNNPRVLVTDAARGSALAFIRSLGRKGIDVVAADSSGMSPGMHSRFAKGTLRYPSPESLPLEFVKSLLTFVRDHRIDLVIPITDATILPLSKAQDEFAGLCKIAIPDALSLDVVTDKSKTMQLAESVSVPTPKTFVVHTVEDALQQQTKLGWPVVLKPQSSRSYDVDGALESFGVTYADNSVSLASEMTRFEGRCPVLLQEFCDGIGFGVELLVNHGRPIAAFQHKRLRELPINGGPSALRESVQLDPELYEHSVRLLQELNWTGLAMIEFKVGKGGTKLMEINGRVWGSLPLAVHAGMDFPGRLVDLYLNDATAKTLPDVDYRIGLRGHSFDLEVKWIASVLFKKPEFRFLESPRKLEAFIAMTQLLNPKYKFDVFSLSDVKPGLVQLGKTIANLFSKAKKKRSRQAQPVIGKGHSNWPLENDVADRLQETAN